jgi:hypothetical protein
MTIDESRKRTGKTGRAVLNKKNVKQIQDLSEIDSTAVVRKYVRTCLNILVFTLIRMYCDRFECKFTFQFLLIYED